MDTVTPQEMKSGFLHLPYNRLLLRRGKSISAQLRPYAKGTYLAYRNAAVLLAIYGDLSEFEKSYELLDRSTYYYLEASSIAGLIGNLNAGLFMAIIEKMRNAGIADELILFYYDAASRLCDIAGTKRYARFKDKLWTFYKRVSCEW